MTGAKLPRNARVRGFSLIEMLVVVGIIALASAAALPNIVGFMRGAKIRAAQNDVAGALQKARNSAIMKNTQMGITLVTQDVSTYWVHIEDTIADLGMVGNVGFTRQGVDFAAPNPVLSTRYQLPDGVQFAVDAADCPAVPGFAVNQASVRFDRYGQVSLPGTIPAGQPAVPAVVLNPGSVTTDLIFAPAGEISICLIDRGTGLRSLLQIARSGRIVRR